MMPCATRLVTAHDLASLAVIEAASYPPSVCEGAEIFAAHLAHYPAGAVAAVENDEIVGYCLFMPAHSADCPLSLNSTWSAPFSASDGCDTLYLHDLAVAPKSRGHGAARTLFALVVEHARREGYRTITLTAVCGAESYWQNQHGFSDVTASLSDAAALRLAAYPKECNGPRLMSWNVDGALAAAAPAVDERRTTPMNRASALAIASLALCAVVFALPLFLIFRPITPQEAALMTGQCHVLSSLSSAVAAFLFYLLLTWLVRAHVLPHFFAERLAQKRTDAERAKWLEKISQLLLPIAIRLLCFFLLLPGWA